MTQGDINVDSVDKDRVNWTRGWGYREDWNTGHETFVTHYWLKNQDPINYKGTIL